MTRVHGAGSGAGCAVTGCFIADVDWSLSVSACEDCGIEDLCCVEEAGGAVIEDGGCGLGLEGVDDAGIDEAGPAAGLVAVLALGCGAGGAVSEAVAACDLSMRT